MAEPLPRSKDNNMSDSNGKLSRGLYNESSKSCLRSEYVASIGKGQAADCGTGIGLYFRPITIWLSRSLMFCVDGPRMNSLIVRSGSNLRKMIVRPHLFGKDWCSSQGCSSLQHPPLHPRLLFQRCRERVKRKSRQAQSRSLSRSMRPLLLPQVYLLLFARPWHR